MTEKIRTLVVAPERRSAYATGADGAVITVAEGSYAEQARRLRALGRMPDVAELRTLLAAAIVAAGA